MTRVRAFLSLMAAIPAVGLSVVLLVPPPNYGYHAEQAALLLLALVALGMSYKKPVGAVLLYCTLALGAVLAMMHRHHNTIDDPWALLYVIVPFFGLGFVTFLTKDDRAVLFYGLVVFVFSLAVGAIYNRPGLAGALGMFSAMAAGCALLVVNCTRMKAHKKLDELRGEARQLDRKITQELANDP